MTYEPRLINLEFRLQCIEDALGSATKHKVQFKYVTDLAKYLAVVITEREKFESRSSTGCAYTTLLTRPIYRGLLDQWMGKGVKAEKVDREIEERLRYDLLKLGRQYKLLESKLLKFQKHQRQADTVTILSPSESIGFRVAELLLEYFKEFYVVDEGDLVEPTVLRRMIVPRSLYQKYLDWREGGNN